MSVPDGLEEGASNPMPLSDFEKYQSKLPKAQKRKQSISAVLADNDRHISERQRLIAYVKECAAMEL